MDFSLKEKAAVGILVVCIILLVVFGVLRFGLADDYLLSYKQLGTEPEDYYVKQIRTNRLISEGFPYLMATNVNMAISEDGKKLSVKFEEPYIQPQTYELDFVADKAEVKIFKGVGFFRLINREAPIEVEVLPTERAILRVLDTSAKNNRKLIEFYLRMR